MEWLGTREATREFPSGGGRRDCQSTIGLHIGGNVLQPKGIGRGSLDGRCMPKLGRLKRANKLAISRHA
jgi:hypothetical protein